MILGRNGALYGTTFGGGTGGQGTVFRLAPATGSSWTKTMLANFTGANGSYPGAGLVFGSTGALYGATESGGSGNNGGTVFEMLPPAAAGGAWIETVLYNFPSGQGHQYTPMGPLLMIPGGAIYGTTFDALFGGGGVFALMPPASPGGGWTEYTVLNLRKDSVGYNPGGA